MVSIHAVDTQIRQHILARYERFEPTSLHQLMAPAPAFYETSPALLDFVLSQADDLEMWFQRFYEQGSAVADRMLSFLSEQMLDYLYVRNQYIRIDQTVIEDLQQLYWRFLGRYHAVIREAGATLSLEYRLTEAMKQHQNELIRFVHQLARTNGGLGFVLQEPVCSTYSAEFQLSLLGLQPATMMTPVLDLGCGADAKLVTALHARGIPVYGVDRIAQESDRVWRGDWFDAPLVPQTWGTVIAHMSFSTHFLHHHLRADGHPEQYARGYMTILRALKVGGCFAYTPGLPFIEALLPRAHYRVEQYPIQDKARLLDKTLTQVVGASVSYATVITRLS